MSQLDLTAAHCVRKALDLSTLGAENAVTHKAEFEFKKPAYVGDLLEFEAKIVSMGDKSLVVKVEACRHHKTKRELIAVANFVFITVGELSDLAKHPEFLPYVRHGLTDSDLGL